MKLTKSAKKGVFVNTNNMTTYFEPLDMTLTKEYLSKRTRYRRYIWIR